MGSAADIFVSYKTEDRARLVSLVEALEAEGFSVWWDAHIGGGTNWHEDIEEHLDSAKCVIVAWSKRSIGHDGHFVREEARRAQRRGVYLPIRLDATEPPLGFGEIQAISLKGWHGDRSNHRFLALADAVRRRIAGEDVAHVMMPHERPGVSRRALLAGGASAIAVAAAGGWLLLKPAPANANRIAVLPFANLSGDPAQAYFSDGIAEELRSALTRVGMQVIGRTSSEAVKDMDAKAAAAKLDVANILTGSVRRSPETIRVNAQLVGGKDGVERWAQSYDRAPGDSIMIQTNIAASVAQALSIALGKAGRAALTLGGTADPLAQDLVLQSRQLRRIASPDATRRRLALAQAAIARDPRYADAYVEKANALSILATNYALTPAEAANQVTQADAAVQKALALAPKLGSAHTAMSYVALGRIDFVSSLRESRLAVALSPEDPDVLAYVSRILVCLGSADEALQLADRSIALDPLNPVSYHRKSEVLAYLRRYPQAIEAGRKALELAPERRGVHIRIGDALLLLGQAGQAKTEYEAISADDPFQLARLALLAARIGDRLQAERTIVQMRQQYGATTSYQYGEIYAQLGDRDRAFAELDNAIEAKDAGIVILKVDPFLDPIRNDPRYAALVTRLNFP